MAKLIILRGNSGSGKTTVAKALQHKLGHNIMVISQDVVRRDILRVNDGEDTKALPLLKELMIYGKNNCKIVILEGILNSHWYRSLFELARDEFKDQIYAYYYDVPIEATFERHRTKPNCKDFGEEDMRRWWNEKDFIGFIPEKTITVDVSKDEAVERIYKDIMEDNMEDFRKVFDKIPEDFERGRTRYCAEAFKDIIDFSQLGRDKAVLEIGPGTGQATEPILKSGCDYLAIELGKHLADYTKKKFADYKNFNIVNGDFETFDFQERKFDLVYSAATIQWIPEKIAFPKINQILKAGGTLAMMFTRSDEKTANEALHNRIEDVYKKYYHPRQEYTCKLAYNNVTNYGFSEIETRKYPVIRELTADEYIDWISTHATHITLQEPERSRFFQGIREAIGSFGGKITIYDTVVLYLSRKL